jgi:hypothetical protein
MSHSISYSAHRISPPLRPIRAPRGPPCPFWCDVTGTPWSRTMRNHIVAASLLSGPGVPRTWRFH